MRVLLLCTDAYGGHGGIALFNRELVSALFAREDVEEVVVVPRVIRDEVRDIPAKVTFVADAAKGRVSFVKHARQRGFDLTICGHMNLLPVAPADSVLVVHGIEAWRRTRVPRCRAIVSVSAITRDRLVGWSGYDGPTYVLPNAVHTEEYGIRGKRAELVERYRLEGKRVILTVGRLDAAERSKGFDEVMETLPALPDDVVYLIAGGGNDFPRLQAKAIALDLGDRVRFTGLFPESEKADLYNLADVYAMPSRGEGFGFVFLEAMACRVPVIASKLDGGREALLDGKLGLLVDPTNPAELRAALEETLARGERRVPEGLEYFAFARFKERVNAILEALAAAPPSPPRRV
ncbi:MAG TPA: glycosyltransferase [Thermoanaerobaculia bacterium]|nr:glycosyltransferase [Thermoanaerobaculia bacterium]